MLELSISHFGDGIQRQYINECVIVDKNTDRHLSFLNKGLQDGRQIFIFVHGKIIM